MYQGVPVGVVIPAFNEESLVGRTIETVPRYVDIIIPIDDASTDGTWEEINRAAIRVSGADDERRVIPLRHDRNRGVGGTIKTGYRRALEEQVDVIAVMAGDGQMDPDVLWRIIHPVVEGHVAYAKGNRLHRSDYRKTMSRWRLFGNVLLTMLTRIATGYWHMADPQNGYTAISREALVSIPFDRLYDRYGFANDLLAMLNGHEFLIADIPHSAVYGAERSDISYISFIPTLSWLLFKRFLWRLSTRYLVRGFNPLIVAYPLGVLGTFVALLVGTYAIGGGIAQPLIGGLVSLTLGLVGVLFLVIGMWFDIEENRGAVQTIESVPIERAPGETDAHRGYVTVSSTLSDGGRSKPLPVDTEAAEESEHGKG